MGARLRLKASKNLSGYRPEIQRIFIEARALQGGEAEAVEEIAARADEK